jgi:hypothetical protein
MSTIPLAGVTSVRHTSRGCLTPGPPSSFGSKIQSCGSVVFKAPAFMLRSLAIFARALLRASFALTVGSVSSNTPGSTSPLATINSLAVVTWTLSSPPRTGTPSWTCWKRTRERPLPALLVSSVRSSLA